MPSQVPTQTQASEQDVETNGLLARPSCRPPQQPKLVCGNTITLPVCYALTLIVSICCTTLCLLIGQAALQTWASMDRAYLVMQPMVVHRDVIDEAMVRMGGFLRDPRVKAMDLPDMAVRANRIEAHVANISASVDVVTLAVANLFQDPRIQDVDWPGHVANITLVAKWAADAHMGQKIEVALQELDDLMARMLVAANAMSALAPPPP